MAYRAYLNNKLFFDGNIDDGKLTLTSAQLNLSTGSAGTFLFTLPQGNLAYGNIHKLVDYIDVYKDDNLIFSGRVYGVKKQFDTQLKVTCEGLLSLLNDSVFRPVTHEGTLKELVRKILDSHNEQVEAGKRIQAGKLLISEVACYRDYQNYETSINRLKDLVTSYGGFLAIRKESSGLYLDWYDDYIDGTSQMVDFGENLLDLTQEETGDGFITGLVPLGAANEDNERLTIKSVNDGKDYLLADSATLESYSGARIFGIQIWDDVHEPSILKTKGEAWLKACMTTRRTIYATAVDLADAGYDVDSFRVGQKIKVRSIPHGIEGEWFNCAEQALDLFHPENNRLTLGTTQAGYIRSQRASEGTIKAALEQIATNYASKSAMAIAIENGTKIITGNEGGYVILYDSDGDGKPDEVLVMDTPDINTAVKVWRWNKSGLGYSSSGYDGPYGTAITMDGQIVADFITTGTLNADLIKAGVIRGQRGNTYWDLVSGEFHMEGEFDVDKSKNFTSTPTIPYYVGDLWVTGRSQTTAVAGYAIASDAIVGEDSEGEGGTIFVCTYTRTEGSFNADDWTLITNYIDDADLQILQQRMSSAELNISANKAAIELKADTSVTTELASRVTQAEIKVDGFGSRIDLLASDVETVADQVNDKSKTFYQEPVPPYEIGDTWITGIHDPYNAIAGDAIAGAAITNWGKDILVCVTKRTEGEFHADDWILATDYIDEAQLAGVRKQISNAEIRIDAANAAIDLKADQTTVTAIATRVSSAEVKIDAANSQINLKANASTVTALTNRVTTAEQNISALDGAISSKVSTSTFNNLEKRVKTAESEITQKVDGTEYTSTNIVNKINSGSNTINEARIGLTASNIVSKINGSSQKINSTNVDISAATVVDMINNGSSTINSAKVNITAAVIADKINNGSSAISEAKITLTAQNIANKINQSTVKISADRVDLEGQVTISALNADAKSALAKSATVRTQYYLSSSSESATGGSWSNTVPEWTSGKYVWSRTQTVTTKADGTTSISYTPSTAGAYDKNLTQALMDAAAAKNTSAVASSTALQARNYAQYHYGTCSTAAGTAAKAVTLTGFTLYTGATVTVYFANANSVANPTLNVNSSGAKPIYVKNTNITAAYYWQAKDTITFTYNGTAWVMAESSASSVIASWCYNNNKTYIDGGNIYAGTVTTAKLSAKAVTAAKIDTDDLFAQNLTAKNFNITGGSINVSTSSSTTSVIQLNYNLTGTVGVKTTVSPYELSKEGYASGTLAAKAGITSAGVYAQNYLTNSGYSSTPQKKAQVTPTKIILSDTSGTIAEISDSIYLRSAMFKIVEKSFTANLSGSAASVYWKEGTVDVAADTGYELIGLGGYYAKTASGKAYCINVYRACVLNGKLYYGFANTGASDQSVTFYYYLLEAKTKTLAA